MPLRKPTAGHLTVVLATAALFVALDGPSTAAGLVTGGQIKNGSVTGKDIKDKSLTGKDVKDDSLTGADVLESSLAKVPAAANADSATTVPDNAITSTKVADGSLRAEDYALFQGQVTIDLPNVPANDCAYALVPMGGPVAGIPVFVSAGESAQFANGGLSVHVAKSNVQSSVRLVACNVTNADINPGPEPFDLLAFAVN